jgi:hypothetical protein
MHEKEEECIQGFWWENQKEKDQSEDLDIGRMVIMEWILEK